MHRLFPLLLLAGMAPGPGPLLPAQGSDPGKPPPTRAQVVARGLDYLRRQQNGNGSWGTKKGGVIFYTAPCALALLAQGSSPGAGKYGRELARALHHLRERVDDKGAVEGDSSMGCWSQAFTLLVLAEACRRRPGEELQATVRGMTRWLESQQLPSGGWFHGTKALANYATDLVAVTNLALLSLHAASLCGVPTAPACRERALAYLGRMQNDDGGFAYGIGHPMQELSRSGPGRSAGALYALAALGRGEGARARRAASYLQGRMDTIVQGKVHGTFVQFYWLAGMTCRYLGDPWWRRFRQKHLDRIPRGQLADGSFRFRGRVVERVSFGCTLYETAMALLALQLPQGRLGFAALRREGKGGRRAKRSL